MTQNMNTVRYIRIIFILLALFMGAASEAWAEGNTGKACDTESCTFSIADSDIKTDGGSGTGTVVVSGITHTGDAHEVTITVTPGTNSYIQIGDIHVQKLVAPSAASARTKAPEIADYLTVSQSSSDNEFSFTVPSGYAGAYIEATFQSVIEGYTVVYAGMVYDPEGHYLLMNDITVSGSLFTFTEEHPASEPFTGTFESKAKADGTFPVISGLSKPLFTTATGAKISNIMLRNVTISQEGYVGAICGKADGDTRIYNCGILPGTITRDEKGNVESYGSSISSSGAKTGPSEPSYCGSLVGFLDGTARVINCFSYANIDDGDVRAGIVGYNNYASKYDDLKTMIMNCMFYGDIDISDNNLYPIYGGDKTIDNDYNSNTANRLNNYNYFLYEAPYSEGRHIDGSHYNCALAAEERFLVRFEFYRHLLNSTRELAAWYATDNVANGRGIDDNNKMAKWVLDKSIAPYPILKEQGTYPSVVNYDPIYTNNATGAKVLRTSSNLKRNQGKDLGSLTIYIKNAKDKGKQAWPSGAALKTSIKVGNDYVITRPRIDKDTLNYNYNYDKVQLPYYNEVGDGNYTDNMVVTGWIITSMEGGTSGGYSETNYDWPNYNYADRDTYGKDIFPANTTNKTSGRIFAQGAYFNVPKGVTSITIEPYWGKAAYLSDASYDRYGYNNTDDLTQVGGGYRYSKEKKKYNLVTGVIDDENGQTVYTTIGDALGALTGVSSATVYDYAVVLVGNYHHHVAIGKNGPELSSGSTPFTIMSIDLNEDNEPDYCLIYRSGKNQAISPIRFDFITVPGIVMAHKMATHGDLGIPGNCTPKGWFEITTTGLIKYGQFEHSYNGKSNSPLILMGGVIDQFCANNTGTSEGYNNKTKYMLFGDNVWFKMLSNGNHMDKSQPMPHRPISITGGEYESVYLSGYFRPNATACTTGNGDNNAECYIDGGKFGEMAGAGQENIDGDITWKIDHADIRSFYGGGLKVVADGYQITGDISNTIKNSYVDLFCGGPKFGDIYKDSDNPENNKTVTTTATDCVFGTYFGAGYGGTSIYRWCPEDKRYNKFEEKNYGFNSWVGESYDNSEDVSYRGKFTSGKGVACGYEYELFGGSAGNVGRLYLKFAAFSLAQTNNVRSELTGCTIKGNFYGGGSLGKVAGTATSILENCTVNGSVYGAGYSAKTPMATIMNTGGFTIINEDGESVSSNPNYNEVTGVYEKADYPASSEYTWVHVGSLSNKAQTLTDDTGDPDDEDDDTHTIKTTGDLDGLGKVTGKVTLNITGNTIVKGNKVRMDNDGFVVMDDFTGEPVVVVDPDHVGGVFGGGDASDAEGDTEVNINTPSVKTEEGDYNVINVFGGGNDAEVYGNTTVNIYSAIINNNVFGGGNRGNVRGGAEVNIEPEPSGEGD